MSRIIAIDPGLSGAVALLITGDQIEPELHIKDKFKSLDDVLRAVESFEECRPHAAVLELVGAMPGQGVCSMFSFGKATGGAHVALKAIFGYDIAFYEPAPQRWQNRIKRLLPEGMPYEPCAVASHLFPGYKSLFFGPRGGPRDGAADAALLALYGHHMHLHTWKD